MRKVSQRRVIRRQLDCHWDLHHPLDRSHQLDGSALQIERANIWGGGHDVNIELEGIGASLFEKPGVIHPAGKRGPIQGCNDWHVDGVFDSSELLQVRIGTQPKFFRLWKEAGSFSE